MVSVDASPGFRLRRPGLAGVLGVTTLLLLVCCVVLAVPQHQLGAALGEVGLKAPFAIVGMVVARRQRHNPIGWILLALALLATVGSDAGEYAVLAYLRGYSWLPLGRLAVFLTQGWLAIPLLLPLPVALFPEGSLPSRRWRWTMWLYLAATATFAGGVLVEDLGAFTDEPLRLDSSGELASLGSNSKLSALAAGLLLVYVTVSLSWLLRQVVAFARSTGDRRQQLKWLMSGGIVAVVGFALSVGLSSPAPLVLRAIRGIGYAGQVALPVSIGVGILKYRLYEIDRLISRTVAYTIVTGLLVGVYVGLVALTTRALPLSSPVGVAGSTLAVVALVNPLRGRVQRVVDRRFNRARYDARATIASFAAGLREEVDLDRVQLELAGVVGRAVEPRHISIWLRQPLE